MKRCIIALSVSICTFFFPGLLIASSDFKGIASGLPPSTSKSTAELSKSSVNKFLQQNPYHGATFRQLKAQASEVGTLSSFLDKEDCGGENENTPICTKIVNALGATGGNEALQSIRRLLSRHKSEFESSELMDGAKRSLNVKTRSDAMVALGYWVNVSSKDPEIQKEQGLKKNIVFVLQSLIDIVEKATNKTSKAVYSSESTENLERTPLIKSDHLPFNLPVANDDRENINRLARSAILGLGLSGNTRKLHLSNGEEISVQKSLESYLADTKPGTSSRALILETLTAHNVIAKTGISCYYDRKEAQKMSKECRQAWEELEASSSIKNVQLPKMESKDNKLANPLEALLSESEPGTQFRAIILAQLNAHNVISRVGEYCYYESEKNSNLSEECKKKWAEESVGITTQAK